MSHVVLLEDWIIYRQVGLREKTYLQAWTCTQSCPALCDPMDCSPPGSSVRGISQARILEWVAIPYSRGPPQPRDWPWVSWDSLHWVLWQCAAWEALCTGMPHLVHLALSSRGFASFTPWNLGATLRQASVSCTFPAASAHFMSLSCFGNPRAISGCFMTISDTAASHLWHYYYDSLMAQMMVRFHSNQIFFK